jgi:glycosyltransferase involved in cell wall biosynthesis
VGAGRAPGGAGETERSAAKTRFGVASRHPVIVFPAWQGLAKGHVTFLYALARARREGALQNAVVLFAGRVRDRLVGGLIPRVIARLWLADIVRPLGAVSDMPALLAAADWAVLPSWWEGGAPPMAVIEALACGVPTIVSHAADGDERLSSAGVGLVVPTFRVRPLALALRRAGEMNETERAKLGASGRAWVIANASPEVVLEKLMEIYRAAVGGADSPRRHEVTEEPESEKGALIGKSSFSVSPHLRGKSSSSRAKRG